MENNKSIEEGRIGQVYVAEVFFKMQQFAKALSILEFAPHHVELLEDGLTYLYIGYSPHFKKIENGKEIPFYQINMNSLNGNLTGGQSYSGAT